MDLIFTFKDKNHQGKNNFTMSYNAFSSSFYSQSLNESKYISAGIKLMPGEMTKIISFLTKEYKENRRKEHYLLLDHGEICLQSKGRVELRVKQKGQNDILTTSIWFMQLEDAKMIFTSFHEQMKKNDYQDTLEAF